MKIFCSCSFSFVEGVSVMSPKDGLLVLLKLSTSARWAFHSKRRHLLSQKRHNRLFFSLCVRHNRYTEISTMSPRLGTICSYWMHFEAKRQFLLPWNEIWCWLNVSNDFIVVFSCAEPRIFKLSHKKSRSHHADCSAQSIVKSWYFIVFMSKMQFHFFLVEICRKFSLIILLYPNIWLAGLEICVCNGIWCAKCK